jgi:hypothetical protein
MALLRSLRAGDVSRAWRAAGWYGVITVVMTWPLTPNLTRDIPGDLGDPVLVCWLIAHAADHWLALLSGDFGAAIRFWHAGFFHPEPLVTVYSEHFVAHALQILPVWVLTKNIILCYNLLFLASFVIGGTGMYLLARELTGSARGAFVAGLMFMFTPYRFATMSHLQALSSQWMPFALFGLRRYFVTGRRLPLAGGAGAVLLQNLSSGYYLIYFVPFVGLYALVEVALRRLYRQWQVWRDLAVAGAVTLALTLPFALPYAMLQRRIGYRRPLAEIEAYSADLLAWLTADAHMNVWGWLQAFPRNEGFLFPGSVIAILAVVGVIVVWRGSEDRHMRATASFAAAGCLLAIWMAIGPAPTMGGKPLPVPALYGFFYDYVPGFDVSRVPARFTTILVLFLAVAAAYGAAWLDRSGRRNVLALAAVGVLLDGSALPLKRNQVFTTSSEMRPPEGRVYPETGAPVIWRYLKTLPADAVLAHLPFGYPEHELRYLYYSRVDGHRLSNGYSGAFPLSYQQRAELLRRAIEMPEKAVARLREDGVNYVVVHSDLFPPDVGAQTVAALERAGMRPVTRIETIVVLEVP